MGFAHGGCVSPKDGTRKFDDPNRTPCALFVASVATAKPSKQEARRPWYVQQALDATREG